MAISVHVSSSPIPHGPNGCQKCRKSVREMLDATRITAQRMFPHQTLSGFAMPQEGAPATLIRAAYILARAKAVELTYLVESMALDIEACISDSDTNDEQTLALARQIARSLLHRLQPDVTMQERHPLFGHVQPIDRFVEVMLIRDAVADLAEQLQIILATCPCTGHGGSDEPSVPIR